MITQNILKYVGLLSDIPEYPIITQYVLSIYLEPDANQARIRSREPRARAKQEPDAHQASIQSSVPRAKSQTRIRPGTEARSQEQRARRVSGQDPRPAAMSYDKRKRTRRQRRRRRAGGAIGRSACARPCARTPIKSNT